MRRITVYLINLAFIVAPLAGFGARPSSPMQGSGTSSTIQGTGTSGTIRTMPRTRMPTEAHKTASDMKRAGKSAQQTATVLKNQYRLNAYKTAGILAKVRYSVTQVAQALKLVYGTTPFYTAQVLHSAGFGPVGIGRALKTAFGLVAANMTNVFKQAGFGGVGTAKMLNPTLLVETKYSREFEREADRYAIAYLKKQGIPLKHFKNLMRRLKKVSGGAAKKMGFLSTHPPTKERIALTKSEEARSAN